MSYFSFPLLHGIRAVTPCRFVHAFCFYNAHENFVTDIQRSVSPADVFSDRADKAANVDVDLLLAGPRRIVDKHGEYAIVPDSGKAATLSIYVHLKRFHSETRVGSKIVNRVTGAGRVCRQHCRRLLARRRLRGRAL